MRYRPGMDEVRKYVKLLCIMWRVPRKFVENWFIKSCSDWSSAAAITPAWSWISLHWTVSGNGDFYHNLCSWTFIRYLKLESRWQRHAYFTMMSIRPQCLMLFLTTASTVSCNRTSHSRPKQRSCHLCICSNVFSSSLPTAVTLSPCDRAVRTRERPM